MSTSEFNTNSKLIFEKLEDVLTSILEQRNLAVQLKQYEKAAELRDVEKTLINIKARLDNHRLPSYIDQYLDKL